jgi:hypothetical protein
MKIANVTILLTTSLLLLLVSASATGQGRKVYTHEDLEKLLMEKAGIALDLPQEGYLWEDSDIQGDTAEGSVSVNRIKIIYYFIHWGPIEVQEITPEYVRERIPKLWPSEGLVVNEVKPVEVAGHPAFYASATPQRQFYSPHFLIWNCPETGRQFIADMNYNISYFTPKLELDAQIAVTTRTLTCHKGAPTTDAPGLVATYDEPRFNISFKHPLHWYVMENPYGVPHPAYNGLRGETVGSVLAWLKDRAVGFKFFWGPIPEQKEETMTMGGSMEKILACEQVINGLPFVESYYSEAYETVNIGGNEVMKVMGIITKKKPDQPPRGFVPKARVMTLLFDSAKSSRRLFVVVQINFYEPDGFPLPPERAMFDQWAYDITGNLVF